MRHARALLKAAALVTATAAAYAVLWMGIGVLAAFRHDTLP